MGYEYAGAGGAVAPSRILELQRRGCVGQEKFDGVYATLTVSAAPGWRDRRELGRVGALWTRTGRLVGADSARDVLGLQTGMPPGTVLAGELMVQTPAAHRWQEREGVRGFVAFDVLRVGDWDVGRDCRRVAARDVSRLPFAERYRELEWLIGGLPTQKARRAIRLAPVHRTGLRGLFRDVVDGGGEGLVLVDPDAPVGARGAKRKVKRSDDVTCTVLQVLEDERKVLLTLGGLEPFAVTAPRFAVQPGDLVDVRACGFYDPSWIPRHARIVRARPDLAT